jgi:UDP-N-acetylglucosamine 1-carboxyvinyltransferase
MDMFVVRGGRPLRGRVAVSGAKNAALPIMAAALAADGPTLLNGVPQLVDVATLAGLLRTLGLAVDRREDGALRLEVVDREPYFAEYDLVRRMRASVCVLGPLLARRGRACVSLPGGCNIGDRPIDLHVKGLQALGADIRVERGYVIAQADRLRGAAIYLGGPFGSTVTGTCNVMTAAALAEGVTTIEAAACEPEVVDLGNYLNKMGARISGLGTPFLHIEGVDRLRGVEHTVIPDRIEAATLMIAAALTHGDVELENVCLSHMTAVVEKLREIGVLVEDRPPAGWTSDPSISKTEPMNLNADGLEVHPTGNDPVPPSSRLSDSRSIVRLRGNGDVWPADCIALPYPGLPTDVQAQFMTLLTGAQGLSVVTDKVFPDRFMHAAELVRLGARIRREGPSAIISGVGRLSGACVMASDLRASAALVLAGLSAAGETVIRRIYHLDRGYDRLECKLNHLGADIRRLTDEPQNLPAGLQPFAVNNDGAENADVRELLTGPKWLNSQRTRAGQGPAAKK